MQKRDIKNIKKRNKEAQKNIEFAYETGKIVRVKGYEKEFRQMEVRTKTEKTFSGKAGRLYYGKSQQSIADSSLKQEKNKLLNAYVTFRSVRKKSAKTGEQRPVIERRR